MVLFVAIALAGMLCAQDAENLRSTHEQLLAKCDGSMDARASYLMRKNELGRDFSLLIADGQLSLYTAEQGQHYLLQARQTNEGKTTIVRFELHMFAKPEEASFASTTGMITCTPTSFTVELAENAHDKGFSGDAFFQLAIAMSQGQSYGLEWWEGLLAFDPTMVQSRSYYASRDEAVRNVPYHVEPKYCFVWRDGPSSTPWRPIPGTGCAHWVAHQKGIQASPGCYDRYAIRVSQVTSGKTRYSISQGRNGDVWTNTDGSHCGIVIGVGSGYVKVRHCSSGSGGVVVNDFSSGYCYR